MATQKGIWNLQQVRDKQLQDLWTSKNGTWWYAGRNENGTGGGSGIHNMQYSSPIQLMGDWTKLYSRGNASDALSVAGAKGTGTLYIWAENNYGQIGDNSTVKRSSPTQVPGTTWSNLVTGAGYKVATKTDGTLWAWGRNNQGGQLGQNNETHYSSPVQIPGTTWKTSGATISAGYQNSWGIKTDGTLWGWGSNDYGQLGQNNTIHYSSPRQVGTDTTWSKISGNAHNSMAAIKTDGTLWGWGYNAFGNLGVNNRTDYSSPVQIFGTQTNWASINMGPGGYGAVNTDGELWLSGWNNYGNLAQNNLTRYSSPVQVPGTTWSQDDDVLKMGFSMTWALKTDGTMWSWGYNQVGQLMINESQKNISSPVQVGGGMDWSNNNYSGLWMTDGGSFILGEITP